MAHWGVTTFGKYWIGCRDIYGANTMSYSFIGPIYIDVIGPNGPYQNKGQYIPVITCFDLCLDQPVFGNGILRLNFYRLR